MIAKTFSVVAVSLAMLVLALSLISYLGVLSPIIDIASHFRMQYVELLFLCLLMLVALKRPRVATFVAAGLLINALSVAIFWFPEQSPKDAKSAAILSILNMNLQYGNSNYQLVDEVISKENPDVITLEELSPRMFNHLKAQLIDYPYSLGVPRTDSAGIGMFSKQKLVSADINPLKLPLSLVIRGDVVVGFKTVSIFVLHACGPTNSACCEVDKIIADNLSAFKTKENLHSVILIGDMNSSPWSIIFKQFLKAGPFIDSERGHGLQCSWPTSLPLIQIPIDHCFYTNDWTCTQRKLAGYSGSDHYPLSIKLVRAQ